MKTGSARGAGGLRATRWFAGLVLAFALEASAERLPLQTYDITDGLGSDFIRRIVADSRGFLWFCTRDGLSRFDGREFVTYNMEHGLPVPVVNDLLESREGDYWVATNGGGVCRFYPDGAANDPSVLFSVLPTGDGALGRRVNALHQDDRGEIWAATDDGLFHLDPASARQEFAPLRWDLRKNRDLRAINALAEDDRGNLWFGSRGGLWRRPPHGPAARYSVRPTGEADPVDALLVDSDGWLWVGHESGLARLDVARLATARTEAYETNAIDLAGKLRWFTTDDGLAPGAVTSLHQARDGRIWATTTGGLTVIDGGRLRGYTGGNGLFKDQLRGLASDRDGNLWISGHEGAMKLVRGGFVTYGVADGLGRDDDVSRRVHSIHEDTAGNLFVVQGDWSIHRFDGKGFRAARPQVATTGQPRWASQGAFLDRAGSWWLLTGDGLFRYAPADDFPLLDRQAPLAAFTERDGLPSRGSFEMFQDRGGNLWLGTIRSGSAPVRWDPSDARFKSLPGFDELFPQGHPASFGQDRTGALWVGFHTGGLARHAEGRTAVFSTADGLPAGAVLDIHLDASGRLWIATTAGGLARIDDPTSFPPRFVTYTTAQGLSSNNIRCLTEDRWGRLYVGTFRGLDRLDPTDGEVRHYTSAEGLANNFVNAAFRDRRGDLWFGTENGLSRLVPEPDPPRAPPPVWIGGVVVAGSEFPLSRLGETDLHGLVLGPNENHLRVDAFGLGFVAGERLRYQYRLDGADRDWSAPTDQRSVHLASLAPGRYRFVVRALSGAGASPHPASLSFTVLRPIWQRWWFLTLVALGLATAAYTAIRSRIQRLLELERMRTRIATDLHDDIGSSLSQIAILSEVVCRDASEAKAGWTEPLMRIAATSRDLVDSMSDIVWAINPKRDRLGDLIRRMRRFAADTLSAADIEFSFDAPAENPRLSADVKRQQFLVFKESINNAVRHSGCRSMQIELRMDGDWLLLWLRDDGCGFDPAREAAGHGLPSMRRRAQEIGGELSVDSEPGGGTLIELRVPLRDRMRILPG